MLRSLHTGEFLVSASSPYKPYPTKGTLTLPLSNRFHNGNWSDREQPVSRPERGRQTSVSVNRHLARALTFNLRTPDNEVAQLAECYTNCPIDLRRQASGIAPYAYLPPGFQCAPNFCSLTFSFVLPHRHELMESNDHNVSVLFNPMSMWKRLFIILYLFTRVAFVLSLGLLSTVCGCSIFLHQHANHWIMITTRKAQKRVLDGRSSHRQTGCCGKAL
ncbi:hypothetical protein EDC04DRAFT_2006832 [Pisolithus marmoratus]|nr:hypothetical protein EDC04DRAFT_2006832 [Pisolithus marmoratus]